MKNQDTDRITVLERLIVMHRSNYYAGAPTISDAAFDALEDELRALAPNSSVIAAVGAPPVSEWEKKRHLIPMGSLNKAMDIHELEDWVKKCDDLLLERRGLAGYFLTRFGKFAMGMLVAEKLDGISIECVYRDGRFVDAITRGDGVTGERITQNVRLMKGVPMRIPERRALSVRGEIILKRSDMLAHFPDASNPRNTAAGTAKRLSDPEPCKHLTVLFYDLTQIEEMSTELERFNWLSAQGFELPGWSLCDSIADVEKLYDSYITKWRGELDYDVDGLVVNANSRAARTSLGETNKRPRGAIALKFPSMAKPSTVVDILWEVGDSGRVTPVAVVEPVELAGATVQRASLYNADNVRFLNIGIGDRVMVSRRGDVIPCVDEVIEHHAGGIPYVPGMCPCCKSELELDGVYIVCRNAKCPAVVKGRVKHWIGVLGVLEWGDRLIEQLVEAGKLTEVADLYTLEASDIAALEHRGQKTAKKCLELLAHSAVEVELSDFIGALGMDGFGRSTAKLLIAAGYDTPQKMASAKVADLAALKGLGEVRARKILDGLKSRQGEIARLLHRGVKPTVAQPKQPTGGSLAGKSFCFTGAMQLQRAELEAMVEANGGTVASVSKTLDYLVIADVQSTSNKAVKARKLGTKLITEESFMAMVGKG